jgi:integrase
MTMAKNRTWSVDRIQHPKYSGYTVRIGEYVPGGTLQVFRWDREEGRQRSASIKKSRSELGPTPREQEREARRLGCMYIEELATHSEASSTAALTGGSFTIRVLAARYEDNAFDGRTPNYKRDAIASLARIQKVLGDVVVADITPNAVQKYMEHRRKEGHAPAGRGDLVALSIAINWAIGEKLLKENPLADKKVRAKMKLTTKPARPVADKARYLALRAKAGELPPEFGVLLDLAWETGHRISAILGLRWCDVTDTKTDEAPYGTIKWYAGAVADNKKHEHVLLMNRVASKALSTWKTKRGVIGESKAWVFSAPQDSREPLQRHVAKKWLQRAETLAKLDHLKHGGFHMFRRGWATARKDMPLKDVAAGGGWSDTQSVIECYQHADALTTRQVVLKVV